MSKRYKNRKKTSTPSPTAFPPHAAAESSLAAHGGTRAATMLGAYEAARPGRNLRHVLYWTQLDPAHELDAYDLDILWRTARSLYGSCPEIRKLVKDIVRLTGQLTPLPRTQDEEWNREARRVFLARTKLPGTFDLSGKLNWASALSWLERRAALDGDAFVVLTRAADGGAAFQFIQAPHVWGDGDGFILGVKRNENGRAIAYRLRKTGESPSVVLPARAVLHYLHEPEPGAVRGVPDVIAALCAAADVDVANFYHKEGIKYAASFGLVESVSTDKHEESLAEKLAKRNTPQPIGTSKSNVELSAVMDGLKHVVLPEGHSLDLLHDNRPSPEARAFVQDLTRAIAYSTGLDPEMVYQLNALTSAAARTMLEKHKEWVADRHRDAEVPLTRMYQYVIACEMHCGRLRRCNDPQWGLVQWVGDTDKTLDVGRVGNLMMELINCGLVDAEQFTLAMSGQTPVEIAESNAHWKAHVAAIAGEYGLSVADIMPGRTGSTSPTNAAQPRDIYPADPDPEPTDEGIQADTTKNNNQTPKQ